MPAKNRRVGKSMRTLAQTPVESPTVVVRRFVADAHAFCDLIENHRQFRKTQFRHECAVLLGRLITGALRLPPGRQDRGIFERRMKLARAVAIDSDELIRDMVMKTHRRGPTPKPWDPIVRRWRRAAYRNLDRLDPAIRTDPFVDTIVPHEAWEEKHRALHKYLSGSDVYWIVFCPYHREDAIQSSLSNDLSEIWEDLRAGLLVYAKGSPKARQHAIWMMAFDFHAHWWHHAAIALNPLVSLVADDWLMK